MLCLPSLVKLSVMPWTCEANYKFSQVICNLGGTVFTVILLIRLFWTGASFFQNYGNSLDQTLYNSKHM
ncbi:hypothetical protein Bca52824_083912 [Brassica carinata]|uniref:Uncharacterized protein n=1 Tax=Brassica carinata TaxID=52824 RepID=A0A8X7TVP4_BRACI|nr:hypothetical protein Bca52824_083912 [Brassica carinata]